MTIICKTETHLVEYERGNGGLLTIARQDGKCIALTGRRVSGTFRDCLKTHSPQEVIDCFIRIALGLKIEWTSLYKTGSIDKIHEIYSEKE